MPRPKQRPEAQPGRRVISPSACMQITLQKHQSQKDRWKPRVEQVKRNLRKAGKHADANGVGVPGEDCVYDVKFCPFLPPDAPPIFAFTSGQNVFVARINGDAKQPFEVLDAIEDVDEDRNTKTLGTDSYQSHNSLAWMRDPQSDDPLLLFSGTVPKIHVYNVARKERFKTLTGHGSGIQDIVPHPTIPSIFATCSDDNEVRLWNLSSKFEDSWCAVICHGEFGHTSTVYSISFTKNGRYLLSGGRDTWVHLWALPDRNELVLLPKEKVKSKRIYYPHFSSADVHADIVDCVRFYGDLIFSRSVGYKITCWRIDGFSSEDPIPDPPTKQVPGRRTRSAFGAGFTVLFTFNHMDGDAIPNYWHRFNIFPGVDGKPVLAMGDLSAAKIHFWDLEKLELDREASEFTGDPLEALEADEKLVPFLDKKNIGLYRSLDWSPDGKWLVAGYDGATLLICWK
ncbi:uncharacterized protein PV09_03225 [Verruconis gallopava]|uniref:Uncharacterized protein n=1 Tax=Verruconis gallopava TaxID=253628 RepID=A0A0D2B4B2_9PEZI|nr:uncharacterized protein PV09_03225 [Verruconis gallopava]KIW06049.1 hypothetical protein PV09_03225 [Verruconis gallopava]